MKLAGLLVIFAAACTNPANVAGNFTAAVTNETSGCTAAFPNWTVGMSTTGIGVVITQSGAQATANVMGGGGVGLDLLLGTHTFSGAVDGDHVDLKAIGTIPKQSGNCTYTINGDIVGKLTGDTLAGTVDYTGAGNGNSDCAGITGCLTLQNFNATRPPV